jgi:hypothetical protein
MLYKSHFLCTGCTALDYLNPIATQLSKLPPILRFNVGRPIGAMV